LNIGHTERGRSVHDALSRSEVPSFDTSHLEQRTERVEGVGLGGRLVGAVALDRAKRREMPPG
jgi:hypothetical protein